MQNHKHLFFGRPSQNNNELEIVKARTYEIKPSHTGPHSFYSQISENYNESHFFRVASYHSSNSLRSSRTLPDDATMLSLVHEIQKTLLCDEAVEQICQTFQTFEEWMNNFKEKSLLITQFYRSVKLNSLIEDAFTNEDSTQKIRLILIIDYYSNLVTFLFYLLFRWVQNEQTQDMEVYMNCQAVIIDLVSNILKYRVNDFRAEPVLLGLLEVFLSYIPQQYIDECMQIDFYEPQLVKTGEIFKSKTQLTWSPQEFANCLTFLNQTFYAEIKITHLLNQKYDQYFNRINALSMFIIYSVVRNQEKRERQECLDYWLSVCVELGKNEDLEGLFIVYKYGIQLLLKDYISGMPITFKDQEQVRLLNQFYEEKIKDNYETKVFQPKYRYCVPAFQKYWSLLRKLDNQLKQDKRILEQIADIMKKVMDISLIKQKYLVNRKECDPTLHHFITRGAQEYLEKELKIPIKKDTLIYIELIKLKYQTQQLQREQTLQQIILEQKQRIRELETQDPPFKIQNELQQKSEAIKELKQQLSECQEQLEQVINEKQQLTQELQLVREELDNNKQQEIQVMQKQYSSKLSQLEGENAVLQQEINNNKASNKANSNYTSEEQYIHQINMISEFLNNQQKQYISEIIHYKRAAEISKHNSEQVSQRLQEDKRSLQKQLDELHKLDQTIQKEVLVKIQNLLEQFDKFYEELQKFEIPQKSVYTAVQEMCNKGFQTETVWIKEKQLLIGGLKEKEQDKQYYIQVEEKDNQMDILKEENIHLKDLLDDFKSLALQKESKLKKEIEREHNKYESIAKSIELREIYFEEELKRINESIILLQQNYDKREQFFQFNQDQLQSSLDKFRAICDQIGLELKMRKPNDYIKECKELVFKLSQKKSQQKPIKGIERLEIMARELLKAPNKQVNEEIKTLLTDINRQLMHLTDSGAQTSQFKELQEYVQELEGLITTPNKRVDQLLQKFHKELQLITQLREETLRKPEVQIEFQRQTASDYVSNKEIENLQQLRQIEQEIHRQELTIAISKSEKTISIQERKISNLENMYRKSEQQAQKRIEELQKVIEQKDQELKKNKNQIFKYSKLVNELQNQRLNDRKEMINMIEMSEQKQIKLLQNNLKVYEQKCVMIQDLLKNQIKKYQLKVGPLESPQQKDDSLKGNQSQSQLQSELKLYQQKEIEREEQIQQQTQQMSKIIDDLQQNIQNLHNEKGQLIEQVEQLNNLLQTQKKLYYSFRQQ